LLSPGFFDPWLTLLLLAFLHLRLSPLFLSLFLVSRPLPRLIFRPLLILPLPLPLLLPLLLIPPDLGPPLIFFLPLLSQFPPLPLRPGFIVLDTPGPPPLPIPVRLPVFPVAVESMVRDPFIVPAVSVPVTLPVKYSPARINIIIKDRNRAIIRPTPIIIRRPIPAAFPQTPPPAVPEKDVHVDIGHRIHPIRIRHHDHLRRRCENDRRRQRKSDPNTYIHLCLRRNGNQDCQSQKD
jgi:hypothetical protein